MTGGTASSAFDGIEHGDDAGRRSPHSLDNVDALASLGSGSVQSSPIKFEVQAPKKSPRAARHQSCSSLGRKRTLTMPRWDDVSGNSHRRAFGRGDAKLARGLFAGSEEDLLKTELRGSFLASRVFEPAAGNPGEEALESRDLLTGDLHADELQVVKAPLSGVELPQPRLITLRPPITRAVTVCLERDSADKASAAALACGPNVNSSPLSTSIPSVGALASDIDSEASSACSTLSPTQSECALTEEPGTRSRTAATETAAQGATAEEEEAEAKVAAVLETSRERRDLVEPVVPAGSYSGHDVMHSSPGVLLSAPLAPSSSRLNSSSVRAHGELQVVSSSCSCPCSGKVNPGTQRPLLSPQNSPLLSSQNSPLLSPQNSPLLSSHQSPSCSPNKSLQAKKPGTASMALEGEEMVGPAALGAVSHPSAKSAATPLRLESPRALLIGANSWAVCPGPWEHGQPSGNPDSHSDSLSAAGHGSWEHGKPSLSPTQDALPCSELRASGGAPPETWRLSSVVAEACADISNQGTERASPGNGQGLELDIVTRSARAALLESLCCPGPALEGDLVAGRAGLREDSVHRENLDFARGWWGEEHRVYREQAWEQARLGNPHSPSRFGELSSGFELRMAQDGASAERAQSQGDAFRRCPLGLPEASEAQRLEAKGSSSLSHLVLSGGGVGMYSSPEAWGCPPVGNPQGIKSPVLEARMRVPGVMAPKEPPQLSEWARDHPPARDPAFRIPEQRMQQSIVGQLWSEVVGEGLEGHGDGKGEEGEVKLEKRRERVHNTLLWVPLRVEMLVVLGYIVCFDAFLTLFTVLPMRLLTLIWCLPSMLLKSRRLRADQLNDLARGCILLFSFYVLQRVDVSLIYHWIRGQSIIKLVVVFNVLEVLDKLCQTLGADVVHMLFSMTNTVAHCPSRRFAMECLTLFVDVVIALLTYTAHSLVILCHGVTLNVAINSHNNMLLTILVSNNFAEVKGNVFKRFSKENVHKLVCQDTVERFHLSCHLLFVLIQNIVKGQGITFDFICNNLIFVWLCEILVDCLKHSFLAKFNEIKPEAYTDFLQSLCRAILEHRSHQVHRTLVFVPLAPACVVASTLMPLLLLVPAHSTTTRVTFGASVIAIFFVLLLLKGLLGLALNGLARWYLKRSLRQRDKDHSHED